MWLDDWGFLLTPPVSTWLVRGFVQTLVVSAVGSLLATAFAVVLVAARIRTGVAAAIATAITSLFQNTPLLVQIFFWYFGAWGLLPIGVRAWIGDAHPWATLPGGVLVLSPEFITAAWGLGIFTGAFMAEEIRAGLNAIPHGQSEAASAQGFGPLAVFRLILLPQALANAWQPLVGQYLNLMKLSSLASAIGLCEIMYVARQIESYNAHAVQAYAVATVLYLLVGFVLAKALAALGPAEPHPRAMRPSMIRRWGNAGA